MKLSSIQSEIRPELSRLVQNKLLPELSDEPLADSEVITALQNQRILFADDDPFVRDILERTLAMLGVKKTRAVMSGLDVLNEIRDFQPDAIITDWYMEPVSGIELLEFIRNGGTIIPKNTPVIFFTSKRDVASRMQAEMLGANRVLTKPVSPQILAKTLHDAIVSQERN